MELYLKNLEKNNYQPIFKYSGKLPFKNDDEIKTLFRQTKTVILPLIVVEPH